MVQSGCRSQTLNKDLKGQRGVSLLGGCHGHYPGGSEHPTPPLPPQNTHMNQPFKHIHTHLQLAHPVLPMHSAFWSWIWKSPQYTQTCVSCQLCSIRGSICGGRNEKSGEGWRERGGGLKGEREKRRGSLIQEILDPPLPPSAESDTSWNTQTMAQWKKSPLILLLITQKPLCPWALYTFFPFCANALSWEWLVSVDKSPYFILPLQGCCFSGSQLTIMPSRLTINPSYFWWCMPTAFPLLSITDHLSACLI